jgi:hypothetical protein
MSGVTFSSGAILRTETTFAGIRMRRAMSILPSG